MSRKTSFEIQAELDDLTKNEIKDNRKTLNDKESCELLYYAILGSVKDDLNQGKNKYKKKIKNIGFDKIIEISEESISRHINYIADNDESAYHDAVDFVLNGRLDHFLCLIEPSMDTRQIKENFENLI